MTSGTWSSPISAEMIQNYLLNYSYLCIDLCKKIKKNCLYWVESHPEENGRNVVVSFNIDSQVKTEWTPKDFNVRSTVHEYGGSSVFVHENIVYFINFSDQQLYKQKIPLENPSKISNSPKCRYGNGFFSTKLNSIFIIREDHTDEKDVKNTVVVFQDLKEHVLLNECDFYSSPKINNDETQICWIEWDFPNMPWDNTKCCLATLINDSGVIKVGSKTIVCTGNYDSPISCTLPVFTNTNDLIYIKDETEYWNIWLKKDESEINLTPIDEDLGDPMWWLDYRRYTYSENEIIVAHKGILQFININDYSKRSIDVTSKLSYLSHPELLYDGSVALLGHSSSLFTTIYRITPDGTCHTIGRQGELKDIDSSYISIPEHITFTVDPKDRENLPDSSVPPRKGDESLPHAHGYYYAPKNPQYDSSNKDLPPLLVLAHGGPTGATFTSLNLIIQYWTSRGFAILDVNYRGSTGYGSKYRHSLRKYWGVYDVEDCCSGAMYLVRKGLADRNKICIEGGSAGGFLVLCCLTFTDVFKAGCSNYGIGDLYTLVKDTHKFESRYLDVIIGEYDKNVDVYFQRSPINFSEKINCPVIFFQGDEDKIVPKEQAIQMFDKLKQSKIPCSLVIYEGEQHGFRKKQNMLHNLIGTHFFFSKIFGLDMKNVVLPDPMITIENYNE